MGKNKNIERQRKENEKRKGREEAREKTFLRTHKCFYESSD